MLFKKMLRDLKNNIMQFFTIFAMVLIAALVYVGVTGYSDGMKKSVDDLLEEANMPTVYQDRTKVIDGFRSLIDGVGSGFVPDEGTP